MTNDLLLRRATEADIPDVMRTERLPGYGEMVGCWEQDKHLATLANPNFAYFVTENETGYVGFTIVEGWASKDQITLVKRVAVAEPGRGSGKQMVRQIVDLVFSETEVHRLWIGCFPGNLRARRTYEAVGFTAEGVLRAAAYFHGRHHDELVLSMLRPEWEARHTASGL